MGQLSSHLHDGFITNGMTMRLEARLGLYCHLHRYNGILVQVNLYQVFKGRHLEQQKNKKTQRNTLHFIVHIMKYFQIKEQQ